jgi:hypothetical protein
MRIPLEGGVVAKLNDSLIDSSMYALQDLTLLFFQG